MSRENRTPKPSSSIRQPMTSSEARQVCSPAREDGSGAIQADDARGGAVTKQRRGDDVAVRDVGKAESQGAQLDDGEQDRSLGHGAGERRGARHAEHAAGAAQPEDRQADRVAPHPETLEQQSVEAWRRESGSSRP